MLLLLLANLDLAASAGDGSAPETEVPRREGVAGGGFVSDLYEKYEEWRKKKRLEEELRRQQEALARLEERKSKVQAKLPEKPAGILANLHQFEVQERKIEARIESLQLRIEKLDARLFDLIAQAIDEDTDDEDLMMMS